MALKSAATKPAAAKPRTATAAKAATSAKRSGSVGAKATAAKAKSVEAKPAPIVVAKPVVKSVATVTAAKPVLGVVAETAQGQVTTISRPDRAQALKKKDLIDRVMAATDSKKKQVKDIVEATLTVLGEALSRGETLNMQPFGKAKVSRPQDANPGKAMTVKLRRGPGGGAGGKAKAGLADTDE